MGTTPSVGTPVRSRRNVDARLEQRRVAAELVDDEAADEGALLGREQLHVADQRGEHAAAVDVAHEQHRAVGVARHAAC